MRREYIFKLWERVFSLVMTKTVSPEGDISIDVSLREGGNIINKKKIDLASIYFNCAHCRERLFIEVDKLNINVNRVQSSKNLVLITLEDCCTRKRCQRFLFGIEI